MSERLLSIEDLSVLIRRPGRDVAALSGVNLHVDAGEVVGLVGESGGGKSMVARAIVALLPDGAEIGGAVRFEGADVLQMDEAALATHRGHGAALCFQNPRGALAPTRTVGRQLTDRLTTHQQMGRESARDTARQLFEAVGIRNPARRLEAYPHELSGGMAQRVMISLATGCAPGLLIADEPTTGLDVTLTREILRQFRHAADTAGRGVLLISHDLASIAPICDRVVVLYAGTVVENGPAAKVLREPAHPYTRALLASVPDVSGRPARAIGGAMPLLSSPPAACPFATRCAHATDRCTTERPTLTGDSWEYACFHPQAGPIAPATLTGRPAAKPGRVVMEIDDAHVVYGSRFGSGGHHALRGVSLSVAAGETVGVVGESGCGKSTLARLMLGLTPPTSGTVRLDGTDLHAQHGRKLRRLRTRARLVFQDPVGSLSPRRTVADAIGEPLRASGVPAAERAERVAEVLARMNLDPAVLRRRPHELSGGQAQRVGIARALVGDPDLIVFDEPTSALDVTVQAQILDVIAELSGDAGRGSVFISHDLATVRGFCDRVVVLYLGQVVEQGPVDEVFGDPKHPYTRALLSSAPSFDGGFIGPLVELRKDLDETDAATGCPLASRCPFVTDKCRAEPQSLIAYGASEAACWRVPQLPTLLQERTQTRA
ncbi:peptide/nickel transport system ATP-binding protein [Kibdelosporangium banguiense]|uniref:Peptide/nickel transport system ATP-binding protein n=1 Tax=Kibdelosporangium banguiense TaxID=1365924 RepID=A0ABS4TYH1_9PSEU|nr:dipeptide ABC transporter ATP-binding protein [Kibdelosporangium banguiense]MBP2329000.1 peptide/nickel transport system ATP-binding protein [Kibdelosporangium banguiense]